MFYLHTPPNLPNLVQVQTGAETQVPPARDLEFSFPGPELSLADSFSVIRVCLLPAYTAQCKSEQEVLKVRIVDPEYNGGRGGFLGLCRKWRQIVVRPSLSGPV